jgi:hypothetical protein
MSVPIAGQLGGTARLRKSRETEYGAKRWNSLRVKFHEGSFVVFLNAETLFEAEDRTFANPRKAGLWTKADSLTYFDEFTVTEK